LEEVHIHPNHSLHCWSTVCYSSNQVLFWSNSCKIENNININNKRKLLFTLMQQSPFNLKSVEEWLVLTKYKEKCTECLIQQQEISFFLEIKQR
jgi:hypothetical protein